MLDPSGSFLRRISSRNAEINDNILSLQRDVRGNLWAGSLASGLYCLAPDGRIRQYTNHAGDTASISSGNILLLCPLNAMKLDLFSCISYEFKTPLSVISTLQDSVLPPSDGDAGSDPAIFRRNIERLDFLVNQLLDFRNIESRNVSVSIRKYDLVPFLSNIYETFVPLYNRKQITHSFHSDVESLPMLFDAAKMEMLLGNLLGNSFKSVQPGGESSLKLSFDGRQAVIELFNSGSCLTEEQRQAISNPTTRRDCPTAASGWRW